MEKELIDKGFNQIEAHKITIKKYNYQKEAKNIMIKLKKVKKENNIIYAKYYPEDSEKYSKVEYNIITKEFKGELVGHELETKGHLGHAKYNLMRMAEGKQEIKDTTSMWY